MKDYFQRQRCYKGYARLDVKSKVNGNGKQHAENDVATNVAQQGLQGIQQSAENDTACIGTRKPL